MREVLLKCSSHLRVPSVGRSAPNLERPPSDMFSGGDGIYIEESRQLQIGGTAIARASRSRSLGQTSHSTSPVGAM